MISYYSVIIIITWMALGILCILIHENNRIPSQDKRLLYLTYGLIAVSALAEWCGVQLNGRTGFPRWTLLVAKCADYILTPMAGGSLVAQMKPRNRWYHVLLGILGVNALFQLVACPAGWTITIDANNTYSHGPLFLVYLLVCVAVILLVIVELVIYGRSFQRQNRFSLYSIMLLVLLGVIVQEALPGSPRTAYITLSLGAALMFIHSSEFSQQDMDDRLSVQQIQIDTDALTGVLSRHAFSQALEDYDVKPMPADMVIFAIDINDLKRVNDSLGHDAGDELIRGAAGCIEKIMGKRGRCFRTGGDEFVVFARMTPDQARQDLLRLNRETEQWRGEKVQELRVAAGFAFAADHPGLSAEALTREADKEMYAAKAEFYRKSGRDRRGSRS